MIKKTQSLPFIVQQHFDRILLNVTPSEKSCRKDYVKRWHDKNKLPKKIAKKKIKHQLKTFTKRIKDKQQYSDELWYKSLFNPNGILSKTVNLPRASGQTMRFRRYEGIQSV